MRVVPYYLDVEELDIHKEQLSLVADDLEEDLYR